MDTTGTIFMPPGQSTISGEVDSLFYFILYMSIFFFVLIVAATAFFIYRYRRREGAAEMTSGVSHNTALEVAWTVIPLILILIIFGWGFKSYMKMHIVPKDAIEVKVTGQKWFWSFDYAEGATSVNELVVPVDKPIKLLLSSRDVIHSFFVPSFRIKMDVLPNRYTITWFEAKNVGVYDLYCAEYCGRSHSEMIGTVKVVSDRDFAEWLDAGSGSGEGSTPIEFGEQLYKSKACYTCHSTDGMPKIGPSFKAIFGHETEMADGKKIVVDENYVRESILEPQAKVVKGFQPIMPTYQGLLKDKQIDALIAYIKSLK
ncbi:MAG: cytochrome c oxidase subunit II [candidate division Zixibacteria bacterium]|nr:cytochrome c oxidase subunit II [candidate division Zixibacteria bacterium]MBU1470318.1 cytochrome c oxidase subunit II [candidate division Zixibacteria bacterium]MBU2624773.1 cytochrome c oxidase subunit II [candidate division Zixibacteria bacterium]